MAKNDAHGNQMQGLFNPDKLSKTRRMVHMSLIPERYHKEGDKIPKRSRRAAEAGCQRKQRR